MELIINEIIHHLQDLVEHEGPPGSIIRQGKIPCPKICCIIKIPYLGGEWWDRVKFFYKPDQDVL